MEIQGIKTSPSRIFLWLCTVISPSSSAAGNPILYSQLWYSAWALQCVWLDKWIKHWSGYMYLILTPLSHFCFHHYCSSDPVWRFCLIVLFTYLPLSLPVAISFSVHVCLEDKSFCCSTHYKGNNNLSAETVRHYWGVCECFCVCMCVATQKRRVVAPSVLLSV